MLTNFKRYFPLFPPSINWKTVQKKSGFFSALPTSKTICFKVLCMHNLVSVLPEPQWTLSTEALDNQLHQPTLSGPAHCSGPESGTFHARGNHCVRDTEMRLTLPRWNATVLTLLHHSGSAPWPCPTQARSLLRHICPVSPSIPQPCRTLAAPHGTTTHSTRHLPSWRSLCPSLRCSWNGPQILTMWDNPVQDPVA